MELSELNETYKNKFWTMKQKHGINLRDGMTGYLGSASKFMEKVLSESTNNNAELLTQNQLEEKSKTVFSSALTTLEPLTEIDSSELIQCENNSILQKCIIGKNDVDIAAMIIKLGNSDWVRQGLEFYEANDKICPFCQQTTTEKFRQSLSEYNEVTVKLA